MIAQHKILAKKPESILVYHWFGKGLELLYVSYYKVPRPYPNNALKGVWHIKYKI